MYTNMLAWRTRPVATERIGEFAYPCLYRAYSPICSDLPPENSTGIKESSARV